jgi:uncharacterized membrane protein (DUF106 family)
MAFYSSLNFILDPVLSPFLSLGSFWAVFLVSLLIALIITLVYKYVTDQELMKTLKEDLKELQKEMKKLRNDPGKMMEVQKKAMEKNMKYMMHSFKPTLITFIPIILIFGWMYTNLAYDPISPGEKFDVYMFLDGEKASDISVTAPEGLTLLSNKTSTVNKIPAGEELHFKNPYLMKTRYGGFLEKDKDIYYAGWRFEGPEGEYNLEFDVEGQPYFKTVKIADKRYEQPLKKIDDGVVKGISVDQDQLIVIDILGLRIGWFWSYLLFSIIFSMTLRKILKIY